MTGIITSRLFPRKPSLLWNNKEKIKQIWNDKSKDFNCDEQGSQDALKIIHGQIFLHN